MSKKVLSTATLYKNGQDYLDTSKTKIDCWLKKFVFLEFVGLKIQIRCFLTGLFRHFWSKSGYSTTRFGSEEKKNKNINYFCWDQLTGSDKCLIIRVPYLVYCVSLDHWVPPRPWTNHLSAPLPVAELLDSVPEFNLYILQVSYFTKFSALVPGTGWPISNRK